MLKNNINQNFLSAIQLLKIVKIVKKKVLFLFPNKT